MVLLATLVPDGWSAAQHVRIIMPALLVILATLMRLLLAQLVPLLARLVHQLLFARHAILTTT